MSLLNKYFPLYSRDEMRKEKNRLDQEKDDLQNQLSSAELENSNLADKQRNSEEEIQSLTNQLSCSRDEINISKNVRIIYIKTTYGIIYRHVTKYLIRRGATEEVM